MPSCADLSARSSVAVRENRVLSQNLDQKIHDGAYVRRIAQILMNGHPDDRFSGGGLKRISRS